MREKLVRDKLPEISIQNMNPMTYRLARPEEMTLFLSEKLTEEVNELRAAIFDEFGRKDGADELEELADVQEILDTLRRRAGWTAADVKNAQIRKRAERGGFKLGVIWDGRK